MFLIQLWDQTRFTISKNKLFYYLLNFYRWIIPAALYRRQLKRLLASHNAYDVEGIMDRVNYYNKLSQIVPLGNEGLDLHGIRRFRNPKAYYFDTYEYRRYFDKGLKLNLLAGDITYVRDFPSIQKSRPISDHNANGVLLNLDKKRHFVFVKDRISFMDKKDMLIGRAAIRQPHRIRFMELYFDHPMCDLGQINKSGGNMKWLKPKISIFEHLKYKFVLSLEGYDVATNLKWIMSSNSLAVMPMPRYETWFMEGRLIPNHHFVLIKDDYSDLEERISYYIENPEEALKIVENANEYVRQFLDKRKEDLISLLVLKKYFEYTLQL